MPLLHHPGCTTCSQLRHRRAFSASVAGAGFATAGVLAAFVFDRSPDQQLLIAESMTRSMLQAPAIISGNLPIVTVQEVKNKTSEYIDTKSIMNSIQTHLVKSGKVRFVRSIDEMQSGVDELQRQNQSGLYKSQGKAKMGNMTAAKYSLEGEIVSIVKQTDNTKDVFYKMTLKLYDVEDGSIEWQDEKEIRKTSRR